MIYTRVLFKGARIKFYHFFSKSQLKLKFSFKIFLVFEFVLVFFIEFIIFVIFNY
ncbi:Uncharacterised protein [Mycobacteroides abscessus subsp. abscessus]|nr:Uncharacterised protein [Mycobacteroides abscessus subsp. abscessus]